jgi:uncharacterized repeat protein (TIGR01451 family)
VQSLRNSAVFAAVATALSLGATSAHARGIAAGTSINNTATVDYTVGTVTTTTPSNTSVVVVAETLDVAVTIQTPTVAVTPGATQQVLRYRVDNTGNGSEAFRLVLNNAITTGDEFDPVAASPAIYLDSTKTGPTAGVFDPTDVPYVPGSNDPLLDPNTAGNEYVIAFVVNNIPTTVVDSNRGISTLQALARTGTGVAGTVFAGQGTGGTDAVVGQSTATITAQGMYTVAGISIVANKSQTVVNQFGTAQPIPGATINYTIVVNATGSGTATAAQFTDNIPAGTTYTPGTLRLNTTVLTDGADVTDNGAFEATPVPRVRVGLGNLTQASGAQTIQFAVTINNTP